MMAPDPPREERAAEDSEDTNRVTNDPMTIQAAWLDMDDADELMFVPEGPHELDMGGSESEYSTDDDEGQGNSHLPPARLRDSNPNDESHEPQNQGEEGQARGYYQLLIPFPTAEQSASPDDLESAQGQGTISQSHPSESSRAHSVDTADPVNEPLTELQDKSSLTEDEIKKREIDLTDDKVETIKSVMKGFVLPPASIPGWASEVEEDVWKRRLFDTFDSKTSTENINSK